MREFNFIFAQYETDKNWPHTYGEVYDHYYQSDEQRLKVGAVLELGINAGGSLLGWRDYFPNAQVFGVDNNPRMQVHNEANIHSYCGDATDPKFLREIGQHGPFDLIVDDASHNPRDQILSCLYLWQYLQPSGRYIIEDIISPCTITGYTPHDVIELFRLFPGVVFDHNPKGQCKNDCIVVLQKG